MGIAHLKTQTGWNHLHCIENSKVTAAEQLGLAHGLKELQGMIKWK